LDSFTCGCCGKDPFGPGDGNPVVGQFELQQPTERSWMWLYGGRLSEPTFRD
jgi:hypothetical protein